MARNMNTLPGQNYDPSHRSRKAPRPLKWAAAIALASAGIAGVSYGAAASHIPQKGLHAIERVIDATPPTSSAESVQTQVIDGAFVVKPGKRVTIAPGQFSPDQSRDAYKQGTARESIVVVRPIATTVNGDPAIEFPLSDAINGQTEGDVANNDMAYVTTDQTGGEFTTSKGDPAALPVTLHSTPDGGMTMELSQAAKNTFESEPGGFTATIAQTMTLGRGEKPSDIAASSGYTDELPTTPTTVYRS